MKKEPKVSVVLPTHNRAKPLVLSIQSVLSQSLEDFELLIIDDASADNTSEIISRFQDDRIRYLKSDNNVGAAEARNIGIRESRADLIAFQDSDDEWRCNKLSVCCSVLLEDQTLVAVYSAYWRINGKQIEVIPPTPPPCGDASLHQAFLRTNFAGTPTAVIRKEALRKIGGFDPKMPRYQDWDLFLRLIAVGRLWYIEEPLVLSYTSPNSISTDVDAHRDALIRIYNKNVDIIKRDKALHAFWLSFIGKAKVASGDLAGGRKDLIQALRLRPLEPIHAARILLTIPALREFYKGVTGRAQRR